MKCIVMVGLPASGKSTLVQALNVDHQWEVLSSDYIREDFSKKLGITYADTFNPEYNERMFELYNDKKHHLQTWNCDVIIDQCNHLKAKRLKIKRWFPKAQFWAVCVHTPFEECFKRNTLRDKPRRVPDYSMLHFNEVLTWPTPDEGFAEIQHVSGV